MRVIKEVISGTEYESVTPAEWARDKDEKQKYFDRYRRMTLAEVNHYRQAWDAYYAEIEKGEIVQTYRKLSEAFRANRMTEFKELLAHMKTLKPAVKKPDFSHPDQILYYMPREQKDDMFAEKKAKSKQRVNAASLLKTEEEPF